MKQGGNKTCKVLTVVDTCLVIKIYQTVFISGKIYGMIKNKHKYNTVNTIISDRNSGFKNTAYAVAELIDNSIQSAFRLNQKIVKYY